MTGYAALYLKFNEKFIDYLNEFIDYYLAII